MSALSSLAPGLEIQASTGTYSVCLGPGALSTMLSEADDPIIIADQFFQPLQTPARIRTIYIPALESNKSLEASAAFVEHLRKAGVNRGTALFAVGGGIIQDLSAFIASIYMRGLKWTYVPTTILAMVDSCIGGKSSINVGPYKNLVGTFHPPDKILIDPSLAGTLPPEQYAAGLIEAAKICFCRGSENWSRYLACKPSLAMAAEALEQLIVESLTAKKWFIEIDEFDKKERLLLNFGHTFGHALEGASHYALPHGIAVGLGILCSLAFQRGRGLDFSGFDRVATLEAHLCTLIQVLPNLADLLAGISIDEVLERFASDKKHTSESYTLILADETGTVCVQRLPRSSSTEASLRHAITCTLGSFGPKP